MSPTSPPAASTPNQADPAPESAPAARPFTLADLTGELLWPRLFRAAPLALRPERLGLAMFTLVLVSLVGRGFRAVIGDTTPSTGSVSNAGAGILDALKAAQPADAALRFVDLVLGVPSAGILEHPWWAAVFALPLAVVLAVGGGAVCRMAACEFSHSVMLPWPRALGFAASRWINLSMALLSPLLVAGFFVIALSIGGWLLLNWPVVNVVGAVLFPLFLVGSLLAVLLLAGYVLAHPMLLPAMACEGTDAIDAVQRSYAYVVGRPLRLIVYALVLALQLAVMTAVLGSIAAWVVSLAGSAAGALGGDSVHGLFNPLAEQTGTWKVAARIIGFWTAIPTLLVGSFVLSFFFTGSTVLYLLMRQLNDGQDPAEIWMPGMIGGTMAKAGPGQAAQGGGPESEDGDE